MAHLSQPLCPELFDRIEALRKAKKLTYEVMAEQLGIGLNTVGQRLRSKNLPSYLDQFAEVLGTTAAALRGDSVSNKSKLAYAGQVTAGGGYVTESQDEDDWKPVPLRPGWRLVKIEGDSGLPIVWPGQSVIVDTDGARTPPKHNRIVVVQTKDGRAFCKRWCDASDGHIVLASLNTGADSVAIHTDDVASVAVVVGTLYTDSVAK
jgi:transcriptional regulator with XRE-family HTH domain